MHVSNLLIAAATFAVIGLFHPIVIHAEYWLGTDAWPLFLFSGLAALCGALRTDGVPGILLAILGCTCLWSILELFEQKKRVAKGWFPRGPESFREALRQMFSGRD